MKSVFINSTIPEKLSKQQYCFPENIMMENAAAALEKTVRDSCFNGPVLILCGKGNNGGDGLALARRLQGNYEVKVYLTDTPKTDEALLQYKMALAVEVPFINLNEALEILNKCTTCEPQTMPALLIADCLFGTGIHGDLPPEIINLIEACNKADAIRIACDIPSGLIFNASVTVTMGALKTALFSDKAKNCCGTIITADLGISSVKFQSAGNTIPDAFLIEKNDIKLPWRTDNSSHKGKYGHAVVFAGEKAGAGIIGGTAALNFGAGLVTLIPAAASNLSQFKISPELMISEAIPEKTTAIQIGSGLGNPDSKTIKAFKQWFTQTKNPACVMDADILSWAGLPELLEELNKTENSRIVLTPHLKEFSTLCSLCNVGEYSVKELSQAYDSISLKMELGKKFVQKFPAVTLIIKSACTLIISNKCYICADGTPSLAKAGSGDVLAGMITALLAQGYSSQDAAITAAETHSLAGASFSEGTGFDLTPLKLIKAVQSNCFRVL